MMKKLIFFPLIFCISGILSISFTHTNGIFDVLTLAPWTSIQVWEDNAGTGNYIQVPYECIEDNDWVFLQDSTLLMLEDSLKCMENFPAGDSLHFSWELRFDGKLVNLKSQHDGEEMIYEIYRANNDSLILIEAEVQNPEKLILQR